MVSVMLNEDHSQWDIDLIRDIFDERDANLILAAPVNNLTQDASSLNSSSNNSSFWKRLWNLKIRAKVKHFL